MEVFATNSYDALGVGCMRGISRSQAMDFVKRFQQGSAVEAKGLSLNDAYTVAIQAPNGAYAALMSTDLVRDFEGNYYQISLQKFYELEFLAQEILLENGCSDLQGEVELGPQTRI